MMEKGKELEFPEGWGGGKGSEVALRPQPYCAKRNWGQQRSPGVPPIKSVFEILQGNVTYNIFNVRRCNLFYFKRTCFSIVIYVR
jgi:hypothetical protein